MDIFSLSKFREQNAEVLYALDPIPVIDAKLIAELKERAFKAPRKRCRLCGHDDPDSPLHDMLIVLHQDGYVPPHRHHGKSESFHLIEGRAWLVAFDENGNLTLAKLMQPASEGGPFFYRMPPSIYHSLILETPWLVFHEATTGPFDITKTEMPTWAPSADNVAEGRRYLEALANFKR
jgi:cupin fold WbuC family metalloprotein